MKLKNLFKRKALGTTERLDLKRQQKRRILITPQQDMTEFSGFLRLLLDHDVRSYLEIGCRYGGTFNMVMRMLPKGSHGVAVDLPGGSWGDVSSARHLEAIVANLVKDGIETTLYLGDSQSKEIRDKVKNHAPFDAVLIDGDHRYEGAKADWDFYGKLGKLIAFHDVGGEGIRQATSGLPVEVPRLWNEIKASGRKTYEFIQPDSGMGIGVVIA